MDQAAEQARRRYDPDHWARDEDPERALARYLEMCQRPFNRTKIDVMAAMLPADLRGRRVLDFGAGGGAFTVLCAERGARVVAVDAEPSALTTAALYARRRGVADRCEFVRSANLPAMHSGTRFDVVVAKDVIEHVADDTGLLDAFARSQGRGGILLLSTQSALSLTFLVEALYFRRWRGERQWCGWDETHLRFYTPLGLGRKLRAAGYAPRQRHAFYLIPYRLPTYFLLFRRWVEAPILRHLDLWLGGRLPFNLFGWDFAVRAERI